MMFWIFGALAYFIQREIEIGISGLVIGFLFSPYGLLMIGATVIVFIELINAKIKAVYKSLKLRCEMKITIIHGQSHKGSTFHIAHLLADKLDGELTEFFLSKDFD